MDNPVQSQEITMIKSALLATAISFAFVVPAFAQQAVVPCDEASLAQMRKDIDAMTDADKKAKSLESWTAAEAAFKANNLDECNARIGDTGKNMDSGAAAGSTTTQ
jgi:O-antigen ligase